MLTLFSWKRLEFSLQKDDEVCIRDHSSLPENNSAAYSSKELMNEGDGIKP